MFERLKGTLEETKADYVVIGTSSFSYKVFVSLRTIQKLPQLEEDILLYLHPVIKENDITLYGFDNVEDREIFKELISVNKIGPKIGMALLSLYSRNEIIYFISSGKSKELTRASGLGKRGADMIIAQLKDKYKGFTIDESPESEGATERLRVEDQVFNEAVSALTGLGYTWEVASNSVRENYHAGITVEDLIKAALVNMNG